MTMLWNMLLMLGTVAPQQRDLRAMIEAALSEPTPPINLEAVRLGDAMKLISDQTGVTVVMPPEVMRLVPEGADTPIRKVELSNTTLRAALTRLFAPLGMTFRVESDHVVVVPKEGLLCLGRPPTWAELDTFVRISELEPRRHWDGMVELLNQAQFRVAVANAKESLLAAIRNVGAGAGDEVLTLACEQLGWSWCFAEGRLVVSTMEQQMRDRLEQTVTLKVENRPLIEALQSVGNAVGIDVRIEPGALASLPSQVQRNFSLNVQRQRVRQVLDSIYSWTGLPYMLTAEGVLFYKADAAGAIMAAANSASGTQTAPTPPSAPDPYVAKITIPLEGGRTMEWLIRRSELPEDLRRARERDIARFIEDLRQKQTAGVGP